MNDKLKLDNYERPKLQMPDEGTDLLLHSCCAPCAGEIMEALAASDIKPLYFSIIQIFILLKNMKYEKTKIEDFVRNLVLNV